MEEDKPPRLKDTKTRIREILQQSKFVTSCLGDFVANFLSDPTFDTASVAGGSARITRVHSFHLLQKFPTVHNEIHLELARSRHLIQQSLQNFKLVRCCNSVCNQVTTATRSEE